MAKLFASWVHGNSVVAQEMGGPPLNWNGHSWSDLNGYRNGFGNNYYLQGNHQNWFHVALPTPVIVEDKRATLDRVMVLFLFPEGVSLNSLHVWDGQDRILQLDGLNVTGNHSTGLDADNTFDVRHEGIQWGTSISMLVSAVVDAGIFFAAAGGDFIHDI